MLPEQGESAENESESNAADIYDISVYNRTINQTFTYRREQKTETNKQTKRKLNGCQLAARWQTNCTTGSTPPLHHHHHCCCSLGQMAENAKCFAALRYQHM